MKKTITMLSLLVLITAAVSSCKKDTTSVKAQILGKWTVSKIEVSGSPNELLNGTFVYGNSDYIDFKSNNDDQVEQRLNNQQMVGTYTTSGEQFSISFPGENLYCKVNSLSGSQFQFTAKVDQSNVTKIFYLKR